MNFYSKEHLPLIAPLLWRTYRKKILTKAVRVEGEFVVQTAEGPITCRDGYLCVDVRGFPYPVDREEFDLIYEAEDLQEANKQTPDPVETDGKE